MNRVLAVQDLEGRRLGPADIPGLVGSPSGRQPSVVKVEPEGLDDALQSFLSEVTGAVSTKVVEQEEPWRKEIREAIEAAEAEGFSAARLRQFVQAEDAPPDCEERLGAFEAGVGRLREIDASLKRLQNPWSEVAATLVKDPDRLEEAEAFLCSVRERMRPFPRLPEGPGLQALTGHLQPLPLKSADQLVSAERPQYNPLYVWGPEEDVPNALLAAAGRTFGANFPSSTVAVTSVSGFAGDFIRALSEGVAGAWRERWWTVDLLLVYACQDLAHTERAQDEFFHLFEALKRRGARVLLTGDRPPGRIENIDDRLRSRFEGGLVLEAEARSLPDGAASLELVEVTMGEVAPTQETAWDEIARGAEAAEAATEEPGGGEATPAANGDLWTPSRENVVWAWPRMEVRLVEELE